MNVYCRLPILILVLTLNGQVHTAEIIGGHKAEPHSRPYMVLVERTMKDGTKRFCDGFLLSEDFVMSAAHCQAESYTVVLGLHNFNDKDIQRVSVEKAFPHQNYNVTHYRNDMMLLKLSSKANINKNVKAIALAVKDDGSLPKSCLVSGWGNLDKNSKYLSPVLMEVNVTLIKNPMCTSENNYCSEGETGPAEGDSGGPLVCGDGKAYGVVSSTFQPASGGPQIHSYTKIPDHRRWILFTTRTA